MFSIGEFQAIVKDCEVQRVEGDSSWCFCFRKEGFHWNVRGLFAVSLCFFWIDPNYVITLSLSTCLHLDFSDF